LRDTHLVPDASRDPEIPPLFSAAAALTKIRFAVTHPLPCTAAMRYTPIDPQFFQGNREKLRPLLEPGSMVVVHANDVLPTDADGTMRHHQNRDLYYLTGIDQENTILVLFPDAVGEKEREILFVTETNEQIAVWEGDKLSKEEARERSGIERVEWTRDFDAVIHRLIPQADTLYLTTNESVSRPTPVETANDRFIRFCQGRYPLHQYRRLRPLINRLRMIKEPVEIEALQQACDITEAGFRRVLPFIAPGVGEWEIEAEYLHEFVRRGSRGFSYSPIIGSGKSNCVLHYIENDKVCEDGQLVLMDVAAEYAGWAADMTRTVPVNGRFTARQRAVYEAVLRVKRQAAEWLRPGNTPKKFHETVVEAMEEELIGLGLIDAAEARQQDSSKPLTKRYYMHGTGHHLGLDVHDVNQAHEPFAEGMVMTIEPGIYIREEGFGVRLENDYLIGKDANIDLMQHIPIEPEEIEDLMHAR
jgi:Xaa-Pro aminopeptidase